MTGSRLLFWLHALTSAFNDSGYWSGVVICFSMRQPITRASIGESSMFMGRTTQTGAGFALLGGGQHDRYLMASGAHWRGCGRNSLIATWVAMQPCCQLLHLKLSFKQAAVQSMRRAGCPITAIMVPLGAMAIGIQSLLPLRKQTKAVRRQPTKNCRNCFVSRPRVGGSVWKRVT